MAYSGNKKEPSGLGNLKRVLRFARPFRRKLILAVALTGVLTFVGLIPPLVMKWLIDDVVGVGNWNHLNAVILMMAAVPILSIFISFWNTYVIAFIGQRLIFDMRLEIYRHLQRLSMSFYDTMGAGRIISRIMSDVAMVRNLVTGNTITMVTDLISFFFALSIIFLMNWKLSLSVLFILPLYLINYHLFVRKIRSTNILYRYKMDEVIGTLQERIRGARRVKSFAKEESETGKFIADTRESLGYAMRGIIYSTSFSTTSSLINGIGGATMYSFGCYLVIKGEMQYGEVIAFMSYLWRLLGPALNFTQLSNTLQQTGVSADRIFEILDSKPDVKQVEGARPIAINQGHVKFEHLWFSYVPGEPVLKDINLDIEPGTIVAFVGHTGCGKTTMASLILRFYDPHSGRVTIDGQDISKVTLRSLRSQIGVVLQDTVLFNTSIRENIKYGRKSASDEEIIEAAKIAEIHNFIDSRPKGYDTVIGEGGISLSGGESQRIAIARAVLADPKILILDEATSSLDSESEALIQKALQNVMEDRTSFVIAHRLSTIVNADLIVVMDDGRIIEVGPHRDLVVKSDGFYRQLFEQQYAPLGVTV